MTILVGLGEDGRPAAVAQWVLRSDEDVALDRHARELIALRTRADLLDRELPRSERLTVRTVGSATRAAGRRDDGRGTAITAW